MPRLVALVCLPALSLMASTALAATVVRQSVASERDGRSTVTRHTWSIDGDKFHLEIRAEGAGADDTTQYVFNGRTFYACGKVDEAEIKAVTTDLKIVESYKTGACQVVPSNFMTRFFISPLAAVESIDASDGLKLTLAIKDYTLGDTRTKGSEAGRACDTRRRAYVITKTGDSAFAGGEAGADETFCSAGDVVWRRGLFTEVLKTALRQPGGTDVMKRLKSDMETLSGLPLSGTLSMTVKEKGGKALRGTHRLSTSSIETADVPATRFRIPDGFKIFSVEGLALTKLDGPATKETTKGRSEATLLDLFNSAVFCAIAGNLGCFAP